ncbi:hypothetical protein CEXT_736221 [Caerostris extrusa]|uniref:Uncharacterized protein n=1 Tax=Caerostris extrusa TaxID=172846 RepID=A0AAV4MQ00_CAEEX|nr:hypothetical protein CEXT_736221 [Caerostris extrusa]
MLVNSVGMTPNTRAGKTALYLELSGGLSWLRFIYDDAKCDFVNAIPIAVTAFGPPWCYTDHAPSPILMGHGDNCGNAYTLRSEVVASIRPAKELDCLAKQLFRIGISPKLCCPFRESKDEMNAQHLYPLSSLIC